MAIRVITDSTSYIDAGTLRELNIIVIPLSVHFPDESFIETEVDQGYFYKKIERTSIIPTSSQPPQAEIYAAFREAVSMGDQVLAVFISSVMSGTCASAQTAKEHILSEFPKARIKIIDSRTNCMALGVQVIAAAQAVKEGRDMEAAVKAAQTAQDSVHFYFVPETLEYLKKGGRIGTASALLGSILHIYPILTVDMEKGMTHLFEKVRGEANAIKRMLNIIEKDNAAYGLKEMVVHHINAPEKARQLKKVLSSIYHRPINICSIGPVIGLHTGLGTVGVVYCTGGQGL